MVAVLLLLCIAILGGCIKGFTDALLDLRKPIAQRIHVRNYPRLLIWGIVGSVFCAMLLFLGFPRETAIAIILVSTMMGFLTSLVDSLNLLKRFQM